MAFQIVCKTRRDIRKSRCNIVINDTGGKFAAGVNYTGCKNATGINNTGGKFEAALMGDSEAWRKLIHEKTGS